MRWRTSSLLARDRDCATVAAAGGRFVPIGLYAVRELLRADAQGQPAAIPKGSGQCPSGWGQSGSYCVEMRKR
jgi:hypothetical protein